MQNLVAVFRTAWAYAKVPHNSSAFSLVSSQKGSVLFSTNDLSPLRHVLNRKVFNIDQT